MSSRFFTHQPCIAHFATTCILELEVKGQKAGVFAPDKLKNHSSKGKAKEK